MTGLAATRSSVQGGNLTGQYESLNITQNGEAKVVMPDIESYEQTQQTTGLLKMLALGIRLLSMAKSSPPVTLSSGFEAKVRIPL